MVRNTHITIYTYLNLPSAKVKYTEYKTEFCAMGYFALKRQGLDLNQPYVTEKMRVTASTIQRYEAGTIDNTKNLVLNGLSKTREYS